METHTSPRFEISSANYVGPRSRVLRSWQKNTIDREPPCIQESLFRGISCKAQAAHGKTATENQRAPQTSS